MLSIVLLLTGDLQEARMVQAYLRENYSGGEYERMIVYCGEDESVVAFLDEDDSALLLDGRGAGIAASCNAALQYARGQMILFSAASYVAMPSALAAMRRAADGMEGESLIVPMLDSPLGVDKVQQLPAARRLPYQDAEGLCRLSAALSADSAVSLVFSAVDFCFLTQRQALLDVGGFSEEFRTTPFQMLDLCLRFWQKNRPCAAARGAFAHRHDFPLFYEEQDGAEFVRRYGVRYPYSFTPRMDLLDFVDFQKKELAVLEVGCACGATLLAVRNANPAAQIYGIEFDAAAAAIARRFAVVEALDIETLARSEWHEKFDYIILGDVIEHLREPQRAMENLAMLLKPGGHVLVSVPNVMHFSVFRMMLSGHWTYENEGILDRTHLRFFTRREILALLREAGFEPREITTALSAAAETDEDKAFLAKLSALLPPEVDSQELRVFQLKIKAQKRG